VPVLGAPAGPARLLTGYLGLLRRPWPRLMLAVVFAEGAIFVGAFTFVGAHLHERFSFTYTAVGAFLAATGPAASCSPSPCAPWSSAWASAVSPRSAGRSSA
jgi:predicted MFS family arabinose efflux permease